MRRWALIAMLLAGCGRVTDEPTQVVERVPSVKVPLPEARPDPIPTAPPTVFTPKRDTVPPRLPAPKAEPPTAPAPQPQPEPPVLKLPELRVEGVEFPDSDGRAHRLITFAVESEIASRAAGALRDRKEKEISELPAPKAGQSVWLYLIWGYYPNATFTPGEVQARFDPKANTVRIALPQWTARPGSGMGMDWARHRDPKDHWIYVGCRVQLKELAPGEYSFEIFERDPKALPQDAPRILKSGRFTLVR